MNTNRTILVTAFEPFGADAVNPTALILDRLPDTVGSFTIHKLLLPVEFAKAHELAVKAYDTLSPAAVVMLGQAGGRSAVTPELTAKNRMNASIPDNAGVQPSDTPIIDGGPDELPSTLPTDRIVEAILSRGVPAEASHDAGSFVCNSLLYRMLFYNGGEVPTGFIHVPFIPEQGHDDKPFLELSDEVSAVRAALEAIISTLQA